MQKEKPIERTGIVVEALPNIMFRVELDPIEEEVAQEEEAVTKEKEVILTYLSGKMRLHRIRVLVGDKVLLELEPYGGKARITKRL